MTNSDVNQGDAFMAFEKVAALIPSYKADHQLAKVVDGLREAGFSRIVVVDDGNEGACRAVFEQLGDKAEVLRHEVNRGKGAALKTGLAHLMKDGDWAVVTGDADGQLAPEDCARVAEALIASPEALILGVRDKRKMPVRSQAGNRITCFVVGALFGLWLSDTQTGLRGLPAHMLGRFAELEGDRFEYESNMLIAAREARLNVVEVVIQTIYPEDNVSHFRTFTDSARIYSLFFRHFSMKNGTSLIGTIVDYAAFLLLIWLVHEDGGGLLYAVLGARAAGALAYCPIRGKRDLAFRRARTAFLYLLRATAFAALSLLGIFTLGALGLPPIAAKILCDVALFYPSLALRHVMDIKKPGADGNRESPASPVA